MVPLHPWQDYEAPGPAEEARLRVCSFNLERRTNWNSGIVLMYVPNYTASSLVETRYWSIDFSFTTRFQIGPSSRSICTYTLSSSFSCLFSPAIRAISWLPSWETPFISLLLPITHISHSWDIMPFHFYIILSCFWSLFLLSLCCGWSVWSQDGVSSCMAIVWKDCSGAYSALT